jgi:hypothetical protein
MFKDIWKHSRTTNANFLSADSSIPELNEYLQLLATDAYERMDIHPNDLIIAYFTLI